MVLVHWLIYDDSLIKVYGQSVWNRSRRETCYGYGCGRLKVLLYTSIMQVLLSKEGLG